jgi:hypothetical protein
VSQKVENKIQAHKGHGDYEQEKHNYAGNRHPRICLLYNSIDVHENRASYMEEELVSK